MCIRGRQADKYLVSSGNSKWNIVNWNKVSEERAQTLQKDQSCGDQIRSKGRAHPNPL